MTLKNINEEVCVIKAHLDHDEPDEEFILRHAETLLLMAHQLVSDVRRKQKGQRRNDSHKAS